MNSDSQVACSNCASPLPSAAPQGLCPRCLLQCVLEPPGDVSHHVACPHCQRQIELVEERAPDVAVRCPTCGTSIDLIGPGTATYVPTEPREIGRFQLRERVGTGAFGSVWRARDPELDRDVAIKIPRKDQLSADEAEQFLREARAAAQLRHPHIVAVHEVGRDGSTIYIVSDFISGRTLASRIADGRLTPDAAAQLCVSIAEALHHAHEAGVIHRDLKPSNILLDAQGSPLVTDFGLAKRQVGEIAMTLDGRVLGTPAYMAPEQAAGRSREADRRADVYALGAILFELLTGRTPFEGTVHEIVHQAIHDAPPTPRTLQPDLPRDLETICLKCLEKDRELRYWKASVVAEELKRFLEGEAIEARPVSQVERFRRRIQKHRAAIVCAACLVCVSVVITSLVSRNDGQTEVDDDGFTGRPGISAEDLDEEIRVLRARLDDLKSDATELGFDMISDRADGVIGEFAGIEALEDFEDRQAALREKQAAYDSLYAELRPEIRTQGFELGLLSDKFVVELTLSQQRYENMGAWLDPERRAKASEEEILSRCIAMGFTVNTQPFWQSPEGPRSWRELQDLLGELIQTPLEERYGVDAATMYSFGLSTGLVASWLTEYVNRRQEIVRVRDPGEFTIRTHEVIDAARTAEAPSAVIETLELAAEEYATDLMQEDTDDREAAGRLYERYFEAIMLMKSHFEEVSGGDSGSP